MAIIKNLRGNNRLIFFALLTSILLFSSCSMFVRYPEMKIVNKSDGQLIKYVTLVGYTFSHLTISPEESQVFILDSGMPGGYQNINVKVGYGNSSVTWSVNNNFNFSDGSTTKITLYGSSAEGHPDYNNYRIE